MGYMVGVVGKPNTGKSTFFSAATLVSVPIANYPFTTIKPNRGVGYVRKPCICTEFGVKDQPVNSACVQGTRLIPVEMIDVAGLVPGAWCGKGLGNQFLDEIRTADALIHVLDASGGTDCDGKLCTPGTHDPIEDVKFLEEEIDMWLLQIVSKDWEKIARRVESTGEDLVTSLEKRLSGLAIKRNHLLEAIKRSSLNADEPQKWKQDDTRRFLHEVRSVSKPMILAANKIDLPAAETNVERLKKIGYEVVPCCAEAELALRRSSEKGLTDYTPGADKFRILKPESLKEEQKRALETIGEKILDKWSSTGVQDTINTAYLKLLKMVAVYPVEDAEKLTDHMERVLPDAYLVPEGTTAKEFASIIHSDLGEGFIYAVEARSKMRVGEDYKVKDGDVLSIVSAKKRG
jgi:ribosome-binding ATPase YchF (GTP1/OBG family)